MNDSLTELLKIVNDKQDLHPDLAATVDMNGSFLMVQHPLVHTFYTPGFESMLNKTYTQKLKALEEYKEEGRWDLIIEMLYEKPYRLDALIEYGDNLPDFMYWAVTGSVWMIMESFWHNLDQWAEVFDSERSERHMIMDEDERQELAGLPDEIEIYRAGSADGWSWTLDMDVAEWFARRFDRGMEIHERTIPKSEVTALLNGRSEHEIIWRNAK